MFDNNIIMNIYKTVFDTEQQGKDVLIQKDVWQEVTEEGVTSMQYINGTKAVVNIGKVIKTPGLMTQMAQKTPCILPRMGL